MVIITIVSILTHHSRPQVWQGCIRHTCILEYVLSTIVVTYLLKLVSVWHHHISVMYMYITPLPLPLPLPISLSVPSSIPLRSYPSILTLLYSPHSHPPPPRGYHVNLLISLSGYISLCYFRIYLTLSLILYWFKLIVNLAVMIGDNPMKEILVISDGSHPTDHLRRIDEDGLNVWIRKPALDMSKRSGRLECLWMCGIPGMFGVSGMSIILYMWKSSTVRILVKEFIFCFPDLWWRVSATDSYRSGVLQGSAFGPLLLQLWINDPPKRVCSTIDMCINVANISEKRYHRSHHAVLVRLKSIEDVTCMRTYFLFQKF